MDKLVKAPRAAFIFCRYSVAIIVWISLILQSKELFLVAFLILFLSALFGVNHAPMVLLYSFTINKIKKSSIEILNKTAMRFAHTLGAIISGIIVLVLYFSNEKMGWILVFFFAILKSISAFGFCPASKLYSCATNGKCCRLSKKKC